MAGLGATTPLPRVSAKVGSPPDPADHWSYPGGRVKVHLEPSRNVGDEMSLAATDDLEAASPIWGASPT
ncbi:MAG TPA: hypothetical protein VHT52_02275, partial [Stellaceae bacterium]|nr:hypothetical protein [Stellaceae bacterium]